MKNKKNILFYFVILPLSLYVAVFGFVEETEPRYEEGCIEKRRKNTSNNTLVFIRVKGKTTKYHLEHGAVMPNNDWVGKCVDFKYYRNSIGNKVIVDIYGEL